MGQIWPNETSLDGHPGWHGKLGHRTFYIPYYYMTLSRCAFVMFKSDAMFVCFFCVYHAGLNQPHALSYLISMLLYIRNCLSSS